jgi:hypothetical protein
MKAMWHVINIEVRESLKYYNKIYLHCRIKIISNPQNLAGMLNTLCRNY